MKRETVPLVVVRKDHGCRLCGQRIAKGESVLRWTGIVDGEGWFTSHAHPECYKVTEDEKWDSTDWESCHPGGIERPSTKETK